MQEKSSALEHAGFGLYQYSQVLLGAGVYLADGAEILILGAISSSLTEEFRLSHFSKGLMVSLVYFGTLLANVVSGRLSDRFGRRPVLLLSYAGIFISSMLSILASSPLSLGLTRFLCGFFFGTGGPAWNALGSEICPKNRRMWLAGLALSLFAVGEIYSALFISFCTETSWRVLVGLSAIPAAVLFVAGKLWLKESPIFLSHAGKKSDANQIFRLMAKLNGKSPDLDYHHEHNCNAMRNQGKVSLLFTRNRWYVTLALCVVTFSLNFAFYGSLYGLPQIFSSYGLVLAAGLEIPGYLVGGLLGGAVSRKLLMGIFFISSVGLSGMTLFEETMKYGILGWKFASSIGWLVVYLYTSEVFPTEVRSVASGVLMAVGRVGAIVSPIFFEVMLPYWTFAVITGLMGFCALLVIGLPETKDRDVDY